MGKFTMIVLVMAVFCAIATEFLCLGDTHLAKCPEPEFEALIDFKSGLNDPEGRLSSWGRGKNCCEWRGIGCDDITGSVTIVDLHNPYPVNSDDSSDRYGYWNLSGVVRPSLLKLKSLRHLDLSFNTFQDIPVPELLGSFHNLQYLNLSKAGFSGIIPRSLGNLSGLQYLDLSSDFGSLIVDDLQWVTGLVSLEHLGMNQVDLSSVGSSWLELLNMLPSLTELRLYQCGLCGSISSLSSVNFTSLSVVDLSFNSFYSKFPDWLANISTLVYVDLSDCEIWGRIPLGFRELPSLRYLNLAGNNNLSASCQEFFHGSWENIEVINLASNKIHGKLPASIGNVTFLTDFNLFANNIEGGVPNSIGGLCNLISFDLSGNNLSDSLPEILQGTEKCVAKGPLPSLAYLQLSNNKIAGKIPEWLGKLQNLVELDLSYNSLEGPIPASLGTLQNLTDIALAGNNLNGTLPESLGELPELSLFDVSFNYLSGTISEGHFSKLRKLKILLLSSNSFVLNVSSNWIPPFLVRNLGMGSSQLGPSFPSWLEHQKELRYLDISNASISGSIPNWFWDTSSNLSSLNVSLNHLSGQLPNPLNVFPYADIDLSSNLFEGPIPLPSASIELLNLSNNKFSGPIPANISESMPDLIFLSLFNNQLTGQIPASIGLMLSLQVMDLSGNNLIGSIPLSIGNCSFLKALELGNNKLSGPIPSALGQLSQLQSLHLNGNTLSGELPLSFENLTSLETLDLGDNGLSGNILPWFGDKFTNLRIIRLRSNAFSGEIPAQIFKSKSLQVLDLAENNITGNIPATIGDLKAITQEQQQYEFLRYGKYRGQYYEESLVVNLKSQSQKYTKTLSLMTSIDLSANNIFGEFPVEITKLHGLVVLNLSRNHISGQIPVNISALRQLSSLDLSENSLSGAIPLTMPSLTFLSSLNLSNNNFSGMIPYTGQLTTYDVSTFAGNPGLCGPPLAVNCQGKDSERGENGESDDNSNFVDKWLALTTGIGFAVGLLLPFMILSSRKSWSAAYFSFVDKIVCRLLGKNRRVGFQTRQRHVGVQAAPASLSAAAINHTSERIGRNNLTEGKLMGSSSL